MYNPWAVILFWDSDCSDVNEFGMDKEAVAKLHENYSRNLKGVVNLVS